MHELNRFLQDWCAAVLRSTTIMYSSEWTMELLVWVHCEFSVDMQCEVDSNRYAFMNHLGTGKCPSIYLTGMKTEIKLPTQNQLRNQFSLPTTVQIDHCGSCKFIPISSLLLIFHEIVWVTDMYINYSRHFEFSAARESCVTRNNIICCSIWEKNF